MTSSIRTLGGLAMATALMAACSTPAPQQSAPETSAPVQAAPALPRPAVSINAIMLGLVDHAGHTLWNIEAEGRAPKTDADWAAVEEHAVQLAAAGPAISAGGSGPNDVEWAKSPSWIAHAQRMSDAGTAAMNAARGRNVEALVAANGQLVDACEGCHKEFKPDLPSEGLVHVHAH